MTALTYEFGGLIATSRPAGWANRDQALCWDLLAGTVYAVGAFRAPVLARNVTTKQAFKRFSETWWREVMTG